MRHLSLRHPSIRAKRRSARLIFDWTCDDCHRELHLCRHCVHLICPACDASRRTTHAQGTCDSPEVAS